MKYIMNLVLIAAVVMLTSAYPAGNDNYTMDKGFKVTIHGTSNLHDWDENVEMVSGSGTVSRNAQGSLDLMAMNIRLNVQSIKSTEGSMMNKNTYKALKADDNPEIIFKLAAPVKSIPANANGNTIMAKVNLSIAGITKTANMQVKVYVKPGGVLVFEGAQKIKMTDYGVTPPVALLGTLKTGNDITINFKTSFTINN